MTYPKGLEKIVDKKYAYPAWLFALAIVFSLFAALLMMNFLNAKLLRVPWRIPRDFRC